MISEAKSYTLSRIFQTAIQRQPFPHLVVEDAFPAALYEEIQRRLPPDSAYTQLASTGRVGKKYNPARYCLMPHDLGGLDSDASGAAFWSELFSTYNHRDFMAAWLKVFQQEIQARIAANDIPAERRGQPLAVGSEIFLMRDFTDYALPPHTDTPEKVVSVLYYLPGDDRFAELGTSFYAPKKNAVVDYGKNFQNRESFDLVKTIPFRPNTLVAFPKSKVCFHGVEPLRGDTAKRDILLFDLRFAPG